MKRLLTLCVGTTLVIVTPSSAEMFFDGVPWTTWPEVLTAITLVCLFGFSANRRALKESLYKLDQRQWLSVVVAIGTLVSLKGVTYVMAPTTGQFEVCYLGIDDPSQSECARTFEPLPEFASQSEYFERRSTAVGSINFGPRQESATGVSHTNWRLPMINSWEFDDGWRMWNSNDRNIEIFPFRAYFRGLIDLPAGEQLRVRYVGEGRIVVGGVEVELPPSYDEERRVLVGIDSKQKEIQLEYTFLRTETYGNSTGLPYAALTLESGTEDDFSPVEAFSPLGFQILTLGIDVSVILLCVWILILLRERFRDLAAVLLVGGVVGLGAYLGSFQTVQRFVPFELPVLVLIGLCVVGMRKRWDPIRMYLGHIVTAITLVRDEIYFAFGQFPELGQILVRLRGNDHLVYHAHVREMLVSGFFRGGENVYYFQPGIRYYFYVQNVLFGESGFVTGVMSVSLMGLGIWFVASRLQSPAVSIRVAQYLGVISLLIWWSSSHTTQSSIFGLSEFGTWIIASFIVGLMLSNLRNTRIVAIAILGGIAVWIRPNQGLAMIGLVFGAAMFSHMRRGIQLRRAGIGLGVLLMILLLMPIHNYVFGGIVAFQPVGAVVASQLTWEQLSRVLEDSVAQDFLLSNFKAALYLPSFLSEIYSYRLALAILGFWVTIILVAVQLLRSRKQMLRLVFALAVVAAQAVPFLKYTIVRYHPIQIVAIHLTAILVMLYLSVQDHDNESRTVAVRDVHLAESSDV